MCYSPTKLFGEWDEGYVMDYHSKHSEIIGEDAFGHYIFDTERTTLGELIYQLKYRNIHSAAEEIVNIISDFVIETLGDRVDCVLPIPPTKKRDIQPVFLIAEHLAQLLNCDTKTGVLIKTDCIQAKNLNDKSQIVGKIVQKKFAKRKANILLVDDLYSSGTTANECVKTLRNDPNINKIYYIAITRTKR